MSERPVSERTRRRLEREAADACAAREAFVLARAAARGRDRLSLVLLSDLVDAWNAMTPADRRELATCNGHHAWAACAFGRICIRCCAKDLD